MQSACPALHLYRPLGRVWLHKILSTLSKKFHDFRGEKKVPELKRFVLIFSANFI